MAFKEIINRGGANETRCRGGWVRLGMRGLLGVIVCIALWGCELPWQKQHGRVIRIQDDQIDVQRINNAIVKYILEKGYGYRVVRIERTIKEMQRMVAAGEIDLSLEVWKANNLVWYQQEIAVGRIIDLGPIYSGGRQFWMVPQWVSERYHIRTVDDLREHWQLFQDPEDPSKGLFFNCIIGWSCREINTVKLAAYGLDKYYNAVSPSSPDALEAALENAQLKKVPIFGYYWTPNALIGAYDWRVLEEPPFSDGCWQKVAAAAVKSILPLESACAYGTSPVHKIAHHGLIRKAPDVVEMLKRLNLGLDALNDLLRWQRQNNNQEWEGAAIYFLRHYEETWKGWVTTEAYDQVRLAISRESKR